ncbi:hypothetical protein CRE_26905 [Caenorhabditis remanei]|uniref:F-box domain-containing protein n=1 Tax=Caenorhabditis remanei TaxID=31234 RepID=E3NTC6_CAERE|nr:hypothetical protein CRE_26905 [Caenorhabditis remanei]
MTSPSPLFRLLFWIISVFFQAIKSFLVLNGLLPPPHFPLLHVPSVPLRRIIDFMESDSLVLLSFCSRKSHSVIKTQRRAPFAGRLCVSEYRNFLSYITFQKRSCVLSVSSITSEESEEMEYVRINRQYVGVYRSNGNLVLHWHGNTGGLRNTEDKLNGLKAITNYVTNLFNIDVSEVCVFKDAIKMIEWVNRRQKTPLKKVVNIAWGVIPSEVLIYILRDCTTLSEISIHAEAAPNFRFSGNFRNIDCLDIWHGKWVTIDNLLTMDGIVISLEKSTLTNTDLNVFLRHWLSGGCPRLKLFSATTGDVDILQVLHGLMHNAVLVENRRDYTSPFGHQWTLWNGYDIKRSDGVTATVHYQPLGATGALVIAVWPEASDN